jgi:hypothetical protein
MRGEFLLLVRDCIPEAEAKVRRAALPGSLTSKILNGWFGERSKAALFARKARELARNKAL